jgi:hypothetical protein
MKELLRAKTGQQWLIVAIKNLASRVALVVCYVMLINLNIY